MSLESIAQRISQLSALEQTLSGAVPSVPANFGQALAQQFAGAPATLPGVPGLPGAPGLPGMLGAPGTAPAVPGFAPSPYAAAGALGAPGFAPPPWMLGVQPMYGAAPMAPAASAGQHIVALAQQEVGVSESPPGSNDSPRIRTYRSATAGAVDTPGPWCAYFVSWLTQQAGVPIGPNGQGEGYVPTVKNWAQQTGRWFSGQPPQPGDLVVFDRTGSGTPDHIGIVESVRGDGTVQTIEGNSSDKVSRRTYAPGSGGIIGYVRPS